MKTSLDLGSKGLFSSRARADQNFTRSAAEDRYMQDGYCVVTFPMRIDLIMTLVYRAVSPMDRLGRKG